MQTLIELLDELGNDPWSREAFGRDPEGYLRAFALSPSERHQALEGAVPACAADDWQRCSSVLDPGWDPTPNPDPPPVDD
jgi:hypothetical protein